MRGGVAAPHPGEFWQELYSLFEHDVTDDAEDTVALKEDDTASAAVAPPTVVWPGTSF